LIAPNNVVVNNLFGCINGLGMGILTFDWATISYVTSPLVTPVCQCLQDSIFSPNFVHSGGLRWIRLFRWSSGIGLSLQSYTVRYNLLVFILSNLFFFQTQTPGTPRICP
jgi:hypothetical protein